LQGGGLERGSAAAAAGLLLLLALASLARAEPAQGAGERVVLRGEVVETACFVMGDRRGPGHRQCAIACARAGQPLGILDERSGTLFFEVLDRRVEHPSDPLLPHLAERVEVRGRRLDRGGISGIEVESVRPLGHRR